MVCGISNNQNTIILSFFVLFLILLFEGCQTEITEGDCENYISQATEEAVEKACDEGYVSCISACERAACEDACEEGKQACESSM